jgi:hypothetical protein
MAARTPSKSGPSFKFLRDEPADTDAFGSHEKIAEVLATAITDNPELRVVGLIGPWGSGKSTVVGFLKRELANRSSIDSRMFTYDAWLHQSDPPRRAFLEGLIHFLIDGKLVDKDAWQLELDRLNGRIEDTLVTTTPVFTAYGALVLLSLFGLPLGWGLLTNAGIKNALRDLSTLTFQFGLGMFLLISPALVALGVWLRWRPVRNVFSQAWWSKANWSTHRPPNEHASILSMFFNKETTSHKNRVTRDPVPTAIEFQETFRDIMQAVSEPDRRFVFIVDNLDRLPGDEALEMWSTIRSFFLGAGKKGNAGATAEPIVVLPLDEEAVQKIYGKSPDDEDGQARTRAFMEKTFDLTLRVTRPVQTEWQGYLESQMTILFGDQLGTDWTKRVGQYLDTMFLSDLTAPITPRRINAIANSIAVTWMQWYDSGIPFSSVAYYCVFRQSIDGKVGLQLAAPKASVERFDENWSRSIAALHFGVAPEIAYQVLLEGPLRKALIEGDSDKVGHLMDQPGFSGVFRRIIDQYGDATTPTLVVSTINCLTTAESMTSNFAEEWAVLADALVLTPAWASFVDADRRAVGALLDRIDGPSKRKVFASTLSHIINSPGAAQPEIADGIGNLLVDVHDRHSELLSPNLTVALPANPETFVRVAAICGTRPGLVSVLRPPTNAGDVSAILTNDLIAADHLDAESRLRAVLGTPLEVLTEPYLTTALQVVSRSNQTTSSTALLALALANRRGLPFAVSQVSGLAGNGRLGALISEGWAALEWDVFARAVALLLLKAPNACPALQPALEARALVYPQLGRQLDVALREFADDMEASFEALTDIVAASPPSRPYVVAILSDRLNDASSVAPSTKALVDRFAQMQSLFSPVQLTALVSRYADDDALWTILDTLPLAGTALSVLRELGAGMPATADRPAEALTSALQRATEADWTAALAAPGDLLNGLELLSTWREARIHIPALFAPLLSAQEQVIAAENAMWLSRYFYLVSFLPPASSQTVLRSLRDRVLATSSIPMLVTLLNEGGSSLIGDGHFDEKADEIVRRLIIEFLEKPEILAYLHRYVDALASTVAVSRPESREELARKLEELSANGTEEPNRWASELIVRWDLGDEPTMNA